MTDHDNLFPSDRGQHWSARLGHEADAIAREAGMTLPLPGMRVSAVSAAVPPRPVGGMPPQAPARVRAALTFLDNQAVFVVRVADAPLRFRFLRTARRERARVAP
jgi:hypothetical protein